MNKHEKEVAKGVFVGNMLNQLVPMAIAVVLLLLLIITI